MVRDGVEGRLFASGDSAAFGAAVRDLWADPDRRAQMATAARATAEREHSPLASLHALRRIYAEAVATRHPGAVPAPPTPDGAPLHA
ncbi:MAG TPA: glycosyltransferase, partial [Rubricoccaceae bacterium]|jgi:glycosyltransferase involved in cell wall biosynthesis